MPVCVAAGILAYFDRATEPGIGLTAAVFACGLAAVAGTWRSGAWRVVGLAALLAALGFSAAALRTAREAPWDRLPRHAVLVAGRIAAIEALPDGGRRIILTGTRLGDTPAGARLDGALTSSQRDGTARPLARALRVHLRRGDDTPLGSGDTVRVRALLQPPAPPAYPGAPADAQRDAFFGGIAGYGMALGPAALVAAARPGPLAAIGHMRDAVAARAAAGLPGPRGAIAATLLSGRGTAIPEAVRADFAASGLAHLLAVAGLHVGIVMALAFWAVRAGLALSDRVCLRLPCKAIAAAGALGAGGFYLVLTGGHLPIVRAFLMASLVTAGLLAGRRALSLRGLAIVATAILLASPPELLGASFQLSFSAVLALIAGFATMRPALDRLRGGTAWRRAAHRLAGLALTSLLAGAASAPFAAAQFGQASLTTVPANLVAVPLTAFWVMPLGLLALPLMPLGLERLALQPMGWGIGVLIALAHAVAGWPGSHIPVRPVPGCALVLTALGLAWLGLWRGTVRLAGLPLLAAALLLWMSARPPDLLLSPDAWLLAVRAGGLVRVAQAGRVSAIEAEAPLRQWGVATTGTLAWSEAEGGGGLACGSGICRLRTREGEAVLLRGAGTDPGETGCQGAAIVLALAWRAPDCGGGVPALGRHDAMWQGAATVRLSGGRAVVVTDRGWRGSRPWVLLGTGLPMAPTE